MKKLYYGDFPNEDTVIKRKVILTNPWTADGIRFDLIDDKPNVLLKFDLIGLSNDKAYKANPILDEKEYLDCKYIENHI